SYRNFPSSRNERQKLATYVAPTASGVERKGRPAAALANASRGERSDVGHAPRLHELAGPVAAVQARDHHVLAGARGVHEAAVAHVDAHMVHAPATAAEEDQVAGAERVALHLLAALGHFARNPR